MHKKKLRKKLKKKQKNPQKKKKKRVRVAEARKILKEQEAQNLLDMGVPRAYALDGGRTTVITMDGELVTNPDHGDQRKISDIIYFATAVPDGGGENG